MNLEVLNKVDLEKLTLDERLRIQELIQELKDRKTNYPIIDFKLQEHQQKLADAIAKTNPDGTPYYKFVIMIGGNGGGKTLTGAWITMCKAMGAHIMKKYGHPSLGNAPLTKIVTSTGNQIIENLTPYLLGTDTDQDIIKIPKDEIKGNPRKEKDVLKKITLKSGGSINFGTYDQGQARLQGGSPDFTWLDEVPERWSDFRELIRGTRKPNAQFLITFTPTNFSQQIYDWIYGDNDENSDLDDEYGKGRKFILQVDSLENKKADHSWMKGLSPEELQIVRFGKFVPPTGLVYRSFTRVNNVIEHFNPKLLPGDVEFYGALDFGWKHPMAFLFIATDGDGNVYVFDMIYGSNMYLKDLKSKVDEKKLEYGINEFKWIVADSQDARSRNELKELGMRTIPANKKMKGGGEVKNRSAGIMKINQMLNLGEIIISDKCKDLITEFETHHYTEKGADGVVNKENDDALDALRYFIFNYRVKDEVMKMKKEKNRARRKVYRAKTKSKR